MRKQQFLVFLAIIICIILIIGFFVGRYRYQLDSKYCEVDSDCAFNPVMIGDDCVPVNKYHYREDKMCFISHCGTHCVNNQCEFRPCRDRRCYWDPGPCLALVMPGYYYDSQTQECRYYEGSGCSSPTFETLEECQRVCE